MSKGRVLAKDGWCNATNTRNWVYCDGGWGDMNRHVCSDKIDCDRVHVGYVFEEKNSLFYINVWIRDSE